MRHSEGIEIDTVDSVDVCLTADVEEYFFEAIGLLCKSASSDHEPAISNGSLSNVDRSDSSETPERISWELFGGAHPVDSWFKVRNLPIRL